MQEENVEETKEEKEQVQQYLYTSDDPCIMSVEEQAIIVEWANTHYKYFKRNGPNTYMQLLHLFDDTPACVWDIKRRIFDKEQLHGYAQEPIYKDSIGYMMHGDALHPHTDPNPDPDCSEPPLFHTRFNVYVQLPEKGGYPIYANLPCPLKERTYICCRAGVDMHWSAKVEGPRPRIVMSFGVLVPFKRIENVQYQYA